MKTAELSNEPSRKRSSGISYYKNDFFASNARDASGRGRVGQASQNKYISNPIRFVCGRSEDDSSKVGNTCDPNESCETKNNFKKYGGKSKKAVSPTDGIEKSSVVYQREDNTTKGISVDNKYKNATYKNLNNRSRTTLNNNKVDNNGEGITMGRDRCFRANPTIYNHGTVGAKHYKYGYKNLPYLVRKRRGGEYVDVEASNVWRLMCPAFDTLLKAKDVNSLQKSCRDYMKRMHNKVMNKHSQDLMTVNKLLNMKKISYEIVNNVEKYARYESNSKYLRTCIKEEVIPPKFRITVPEDKELRGNMNVKRAYYKACTTAMNERKKLIAKNINKLIAETKQKCTEWHTEMNNTNIEVNEKVEMTMYFYKLMLQYRNSVCIYKFEKHKKKYNNVLRNDGHICVGVVGLIKKLWESNEDNNNKKNKRFTYNCGVNHFPKRVREYCMAPIDWIRDGLRVELYNEEEKKVKEINKEKIKVIWDDTRN